MNFSEKIFEKRVQDAKDILLPSKKNRPFAETLLGRIGISVPEFPGRSVHLRSR